MKECLFMIVKRLILLTQGKTKYLHSGFTKQILLLAGGSNYQGSLSSINLLSYIETDISQTPDSLGLESEWNVK